MNAVDNECWGANAREIRESLPRELFPFSEGGYLCCGDLGSGRGLPILLALREATDELLARGLARITRSEENLLQNRISLKRRVAEVPGEARLLEMHHILAASWRGPNEDHPAKDRRPILRHLLCDHAAERVSEHVASVDAEAIEKSEGVLRHSGYRLRHDATRSPDAGVVEQNDLSA